jgi:hypothetical protein
MKTFAHRQWLLGLGLGLGLGLVSGCQTWVPEAGLTLPTGHYLRHPPQYIPPSPPYPLPKELATLEEAAAAQQAGRPFGGVVERPAQFGGP